VSNAGQAAMQFVEPQAFSRQQASLRPADILAAMPKSAKPARSGAVKVPQTRAAEHIFQALKAKVLAVYQALNVLAIELAVQNATASDPAEMQALEDVQRAKNRAGITAGLSFGSCSFTEPLAELAPGDCLR
jgi:hypothetical protein